MLQNSRRAVLGAYAGLLRVQRSCFQGDVVMKQGAALETRKQFEAHRNECDPEEIQELLDNAIDLASFLKHNMVMIVQGCS